MIRVAYDHGASEAFETYGVKRASLVDSAKALLIGNPSRYLAELRSGDLFRRGGLIAETAFTPPFTVRADQSNAGQALRHTGNAALMVGMPAYGLYSAARAPRERRGSALGAALGATAGGLVGAPLGVLGAMIGSGLGQALGESVGRTFNRPFKHSTHPVQQRTDHAGTYD